MRVIAIAQGYGGKDKHAIREPGDVFEVPEGSKASWFKPVEDDEQADRPRSRKTGGQQAGSDLA